ncbi:DNA-binding PadR family transcriptional regulator [Methanomicrobium sp. W14]|uniref:PadR family transcriptional regulator n=1 Tax=Methanomicrobium sp. W14 TaxID=2817839 RepID=UPI001AEB92DD|nr:PadR family transcriptional regulator [Methanomicrobium sp. W14]MBP2133076.1 DNA-binding PadR family transcriptional regulator [Methanomicrobium sp. W14]
MHSLWKFSPEKGKERGLLTILVLHFLEKEPKSGYDLLKEIAEKTEGTWVPNKGTMYPLLKSLEKEGLIRIKEIGKRSKTIYELTDAGKITLSRFKTEREESEERVNFFKKMHLEIFGEENISLIYLMMDIRFCIEKLPKERKEQAKEILRQSFEKIKELEKEPE